jgi:hypothetical protein
VAKQETGLIEIAQATAQPESIEAGDYTRDIRAVPRQKQLHAAAMMTRRFGFHSTTLSPPARRGHGLCRYAATFAGISVASASSVFPISSAWLRREPR